MGSASTVGRDSSFNRTIEFLDAGFQIPQDLPYDLCEIVVLAFVLESLGGYRLGIAPVEVDPDDLHACFVQVTDLVVDPFASGECQIVLLECVPLTGVSIKELIQGMVVCEEHHIGHDLGNHAHGDCLQAVHHFLLGLFEDAGLGAYLYQVDKAEQAGEQAYQRYEYG